MSNALSVAPMPTSDEGDNSLEKYRSRPKQLARWMLESRDTLWEKYQGLKVELKRLKVRVSDVTSRSGLTSLILVWAALFGATTSEVIRQALTEVPVKLVKAWGRTHLGSTIQSKRTKLAHALRTKLTENQEDC